MKNQLIIRMKSSNLLLNFVAAIYSLPTLFCVIGKRHNNIQYTGAFLRKTRIQINGKNNVVKIAPENRLYNCLLYVSGNNCNIQIEKHCILNDLELWIEDDGGKIIVGYKTTIQGGHIAATEGESIIIGEDCMFSNRIVIRNGDSHAIFSKDTNQRINSNKPIKIGTHVWLGADVKILKGVTIGDGAIISTGAIVTGNVEPDTIYAGVPAKKVKDNIYWKRDRY